MMRTRQLSTVWVQLILAVMAWAAVSRNTIGIGIPLIDSTTDVSNLLSQLAQHALRQSKAAISDSEKRGGTCRLENTKVRQEWGTLTKKQKLDYINAVKCLQSKPPLSPESAVPGARSRYDDFVGTHINQTLAIHYTGNFLAWHRYFTWLYEEALRNECGYTGNQPYWDWTITAVTGLDKSPIWDGSETSMSGNGIFIPNQGQMMLGGSNGLPPLYLPPGSGGGCVTSGPFVNMSVNLGPASLAVPGGSDVVSPNGPLSYNPRCLKRSFTDYCNQNFANASSVINLLLGSLDIDTFQMQMQGVPGAGSIGVHGGGHYSMGGDPGRDVFVSPGDPAFYLHHGMIDRTWWIWQMLDPENRVNAVGGTNTFLNNPPSANTTLEDYVNYGYAAGPPRQLKDLMNTLDGPFCYVYL